MLLHSPAAARPADGSTPKPDNRSTSVRRIGENGIAKLDHKGGLGLRVLAPNVTRTQKGREVAERLWVILTVGLLLAGLSTAFAEENKTGALERQGRALAERLCARCHAIGRGGASPHNAAPTFRELSRRIDLDTFPTRLREGLTSGHPDMPTFRFAREDARALTAYLRSVQGP